MGKAIDEGEFEEVGESEGSFGEEDFWDVDFEERNEILSELVVLGKLQPDWEGLASFGDDIADFFGEVVCFVFVGGNVGVAGETESCQFSDFFTGKEVPAKMGGEVFEEDESTFVENEHSRNAGGEGENDDAGFLGFGVVDAEGNADGEGGDDFPGVFRSEQEG